MPRKIKALSSMPETAEEALKCWDAGDRLWTIEMGGLGPGYEQCIHILVFEIIRDTLAKRTKSGPKWGEEAISRLNPKLGFSGAQVGAAKSLAHLAVEKGWAKMVDSFRPDRTIQVCREFPRWEESDAR